ncbi:MAG: histidine phosphatase family protein [Nanoarchaeota archaeon]|nr:histidine phosphatase family protein [Nanoarchaeota archaeon]
MKLILVRHGETIWNRQMRLQGQKDIPISKTGLVQAKLLAKKLSKEKIDVIYTSRLQRTIKTADEIKKFHKNVRLIKEKSLNEMSWGIWEGLKLSQKNKKFRELQEVRDKDVFKYNAPKAKDFFNFIVPGGESQKMLKDRVKKILKKIIKQNKDKTILIAGHGGVNRAILGILLKWSNEKVLSVRLNNASITVLNIKDNKIRINMFNSGHHLKNGSMPC